MAVVNVSLAGDNNALMALAVHRASARGTMLVAAAGNAGPNAPPAYPGALPEVIAVTAVDQTVPFSRGQSRRLHRLRRARGQNLGTESRWPGALSDRHLLRRALCARHRGAGGDAGAPPNAEALRRRLAAKAHALGTGGKNPVFGYGLVQAGASCGVVALAE